MGYSGGTLFALGLAVCFLRRRFRTGVVMMLAADGLFAAAILAPQTVANWLMTYGIPESFCKTAHPVLGSVLGLAAGVSLLLCRIKREQVQQALPKSAVAESSLSQTALSPVRLSGHRSQIPERAGVYADPAWFAALRQRRQ